MIPFLPAAFLLTQCLSWRLLAEIALMHPQMLNIPAFAVQCAVEPCVPEITASSPCLLVAILF
eukprot:1160742-Pelagomonas_calceolata.AAC.8